MIIPGVGEIMQSFINATQKHILKTKQVNFIAQIKKRMVFMK